VAVLGIEDFAQTIRARGDVRQHQRGFGAAGFAGADFKCRVAGGVEPRGFETLDEAARRFFDFEPEQEFFQFRAGPSASMKTPCGELLTQPANPSPVARRKTNGRKPTPCTAPRTVSFRRVLRLAGPAWFTRGFCPNRLRIKSGSGGQPNPW